MQIIKKLSINGVTYSLGDGLTAQDVEQIVREYAHTEDEINSLIDEKLGVIEHGAY